MLVSNGFAGADVAGLAAHKQGRVARESAVYGKCQYQGSLGTQVVTMFDLVAARTGLLERGRGRGLCLSH